MGSDGRSRGHRPRARPGEEIRPLFFGYRAERKAREMIVKAGAAMV